MTDYYTHKETTRQSEIYSDIISDDDIWDSVSTYNHTSSSSNMHTVDSTINNISGNEPRQRRSRPRPNNRAVRDVAAGTSHQPTKDSGYVAIRINKLDLYLLFTLMCSILITTCAIIYNFNMGIVIIAAIILFLIVERSKTKVRGAR